MQETKKGLGRGLDELGLGELLSTANVEETLRQQAGPSTLKNLAIDQLTPGQYQPRQSMDLEGLEELAESIRSQGLIQPITVRELEVDHYEIIAGERRWRAAKMAGLLSVPALIKAMDDETALAIGLLENIQREDLNTVDQALGMQRLVEEFNMTHEQLAKNLGCSRSHISNCLRLLNLHPEVLAFLRTGDLDMGHARALLTVSQEQQLALAKTIIAEHMSVREAEALVKKPSQKATAPAKLQLKRNASQQLSLRLDLPVQVKSTAAGKGQITIKFKNQSEYDRLLELLEN